MKKKIISIVLIILLLQASLITVFAATQQELQNDKNEIEKQKQEAQNEKDDVQSQLDEELAEIAEFDNQIREAEAEVNNLQSQIDDLQKTIDDKKIEIEKKQKEYETNFHILEERLNVMYEYGEQSFLDILFKSANFIEFISNYYNLKQIADYDQNLLDTIEREKNEIEAAKKELEEKKAEVEKLKDDKQEKMDALKKKRAEREAKANALSEEKKKLQSEIDSYNAQIKQIDNAIAEAIRQAMLAEGNGNGSSFDGTFGWPLDFYPRYVTSGMKYRWGRWHKGIDIGTDGVIGKRVVAAAAGQVIYSQYDYGTESSPQYGNWLVIYHGNGYATLYAHMNSKVATVGQWVSKGELIGYSGNTGGVAPHLHFEIRKATSISNFFGNNWLDPLDYLPGGYTRTDI